MRKLFALIAFLFPAMAFAQNGITTGSIDPLPLVKSIGFTANYTGDANNSATAQVQYRETGAMTWINVYTPKSAIFSATSQLRITIFGLTQNTAYDVQVTWTDTDGVTGTNPVQSIGVISTWPLYPTVGGGGPCPATNNTNLGTCLGGSASRITLDGAFTKFTVSIGGASSGSVRELECINGATISAPTSGDAQAVLISADNLWIHGCAMVNTYFSAMKTSGTRTNLWITENTIPNLSEGCLDGNLMNHADDSGLFAGGAITNVFFHHNTVSSTTLKNPTCTSSPQPNDSPGRAFSFPVAQATTVYVADNTISGGMRDGISASSSVQKLKNVMVGWNDVSETKDDGIDLKGENDNVSIVANYVHPGFTDSGGTKRGITCIASNTNDQNGQAIYRGPVYEIYNNCHPDGNASIGGTAYKIGGVQHYVFQNTTDLTLQGTGTLKWDAVNCASVGAASTHCFLMESRNNIWIHGGVGPSSWIANVTYPFLFDYSIFYKTSSTGSFFNQWGGTGGTSGNYATFRLCTGSNPCQLPNNSPAANTNPNVIWDGSIPTITSSSIAYDNGVLIANINSLDSAWPYSGNAPDIGSYEFGPTPPVAGSGASTSAVTSTTLTVNWGAATGLATLTYAVCRSSSSNISTAAACDAAKINSYTAGITSYNDTGLTPLTTYYYNVVVKDGNMPALSTPYVTTSVTTPCGATKVVFTSQPNSAVLGATLGTVRVSVENSSSTVCTDSSALIVLSKNGGATWGTLVSSSSLTKTAVSGVATWTDLSVTTTAGSGSITAASSGLTSATSSSITITNPTTGVGPGRLIFRAFPVPNQRIIVPGIPRKRIWN